MYKSPTVVYSKCFKPKSQQNVHNVPIDNCHPEAHLSCNITYSTIYAVSFSLKMGGASISGGLSANGTSSSGEPSTSHDLESSRDRHSSECAEGEGQCEGVVTEEEMMLAVGVMASLSSSTMSERTDASVGGASAGASNSSSSGSSSSSKSSRSGSEDGFARPKAPLSKQ